MSTVALRSSSRWSCPVLSAGALAGALAVHEAARPGREHDGDLHPGSQPGSGQGPDLRRPDVPVMSLALQQRSQVSERDIPQRLAVYHGTRGGGPTQGAGNSRVPLPRRAHRP